MSDKKKWYAVFLPSKQFVYGFLLTSWGECESLVKGRSQVRFKKFSEEQNAKDYLKDHFSKQNLKSGSDENLSDEIKPWSKYLVNLENLKSSQTATKSNKNILEIYVDGSHLDDHPGFCGWGFAVIQNDKLKAEDYGVTQEDSQSRNIVGEAHAALNGMKWFYQYKKQNASEKNLKGCIFYDYAGIAKWAKDEWKTKQSISVWYQYEVKKIIDDSLSFKKVQAHSGNKWNEYVDKKTRSFLMDFVRKQKSKSAC